MGNAGVVAAVDLQLRRLLGGEGHSLLGPQDGRRGLHSRPQDKGHPIGDTAQDAGGEAATEESPDGTPPEAPSEENGEA